MEINNHTDHTKILHLNVNCVFGKPMVQTTIFKGRYSIPKLEKGSKVALADSTRD